MADKIKKLLAKLSQQDRNVIKLLVLRITMDDTLGLDIKKIRGHGNLFRVRKNRLRIVYSKDNDNILITKIDLRNEKTYKDL